MITRLLAICILFASPVGAVTLRVQSAEIVDRVVRLGDVAVISGVPRDMADSLSSAIVAFAPMPGASRVLPLETIRMRVMQEGFLPGEVRLEGEAQPMVTRRGQSLDANALEAAIRTALTSSITQNTNVRLARVPSIGLLPDGPVHFDVQAPNQLTRAFFVQVTVRVGDEATRINVSVAATRLGHAVVPTRRLERGDVVAAGDIAVKDIDEFDAPRGSFTSAADVIGQQAMRTLLPGLPLAEGMVTRPSAVQRGERVRLMSNIGGLEISVTAEALEPGTIGQRIRVRNQESKRIVTARVSGAGEVIIDEE